MNPLRTAAVLAAALVAAASVGCSPARYNMDRDALLRVKRVAVVPFGDGGQGSAGARPGEAVTAPLTEVLRAEAPRFELVERTRVRDLLAERKGLSATAALDSAAAVELGRLLGVDAIITGSIAEYSRDENLVEEGFQGGHTVGGYLRIIEVGSGRIIYTNSGSAAGQNSFASAAREACRQMIAGLQTLGTGGKPLGGR